MLYDGKTFEYEGCLFRVNFEPDIDAIEAPWDWEDGHGPVSDWTNRAKHSGERVLCSDRVGWHRYYDFAGAVKLAKAEGWDAPPYGEGTAGERAARAVTADFERLRDYCDGGWGYVGLIVTLLDDHGDAIEDCAASLWHVESDCPDYHQELARELAAEILANAAEVLSC